MPRYRPSRVTSVRPCSASFCVPLRYQRWVIVGVGAPTAGAGVAVSVLPGEVPPEMRGAALKVGAVPFDTPLS